MTTKQRIQNAIKSHDDKGFEDALTLWINDCIEPEGTDTALEETENVPSDVYKKIHLQGVPGASNRPGGEPAKTEKGVGYLREKP